MARADTVIESQEIELLQEKNDLKRIRYLIAEAQQVLLEQMSMPKETRPRLSSDLDESERHVNSLVVKTSVPYTVETRTVFARLQDIMKTGVGELRKIFVKQEREAQQLVRKIVCIVPTFEKEADIDKTLESLLLQSRPIDKIVVVINGTTKDLTAYNKVLPYACVFDQVVLEYPKGLAGKVNALNWAFKHYCNTLGNDDFILGVDADVICDENMVDYLEDDIFKEPKAAGVMARYGFQVGEEKLTRSEKSLLYSQRHEFAMTGIKQQLHGFTSDILGGQATLFRVKALRQAAENTYGNAPWDVRSKVEDAELTRALQKLGYQTKTSAKARAWVGAMLNSASWHQQRRKWQDGHLEDLSREFHPIRDGRRWFDQLVLGWNLLIRIGFVCLVATSFAMNKFSFIPFWLIPMGLAILQSFLVSLKVPNRRFGEVTRSLLFLPDELYYLRTLSVWLDSVVVSILNIKRDGWKNQALAEEGLKKTSISGWLIILAATTVPMCLLMLAVRFVPGDIIDTVINVSWFTLAAMTAVPVFGMLRRIFQMLRSWRILKP